MSTLKRRDFVNYHDWACRDIEHGRGDGIPLHPRDLVINAWGEDGERRQVLHPLPDGSYGVWDPGLQVFVDGAGDGWDCDEWREGRGWKEYGCTSVPLPEVPF